MTGRLALAGLVALVVAGAARAQVAVERSVPDRDLDALIERYTRGDDLAVEQWVRSGADARAIPLAHVAATRSGWSRARAAFLMELGAGLLDRGRQITALNAGLAFVVERPMASGGTAADDEFEVRFHLAAIAVIEKLGEYGFLRQYLDRAADRVEQLRPSARGQMLLSRGIASAGLCCASARSHRVPVVRSSGPRGSQAEALAWFDQASAARDVRAEALARGGVLLYRSGQHEAALRGLERARDAAPDPLVRFVTDLFIARTLDALGRRSVDAYRRARALRPDHQATGIGLAAALLRVGDTDAANRVAADVRSTSPSAEDPLVVFDRADARHLAVRLAAVRSARRED